jgi:Zn ribbon nucleic-acid-binding protein
MVAGFIVDHSYATHVVGKWVAGAPEPSIWSGLKLRGKEQYQVTTYRCVGCGYLESYAPAS